MANVALVELHWPCRRCHEVLVSAMFDVSLRQSGTSTIIGSPEYIPAWHKVSAYQENCSLVGRHAYLEVRSDFFFIAPLPLSRINSTTLGVSLQLIPLNVLQSFFSSL